MKFLKLDEVKVLNKTSQRQIKGGFTDCSPAGSNKCVKDCVFVYKKDSFTCYKECIMPCGND